MKISTQWLFAWALMIMPTLLLLPLGLLWLWQHHVFLGWIGIGILFSLIGWGWAHHLRCQSIATLADIPDIEANRNWSKKGEEAWQQVTAIADIVRAEDYPLDDREKLFLLGKSVVECVANRYYPNSDNSIWEIPLPYALRIIELVSADLRRNFVASIPGSHIITINDIFRGHRWTTLAHKYYNMYRVLAIPINPASSLLREIKDLLTKKIFNTAADNIKLWLLQSFVKKVGYYAIELYSGTLVLDEIAFAKYQTDYSAEDLLHTETKAAAIDEEPLRILILGQVKAGKSTLINTLFGEMKAATSVLPQTRKITPYLFERDGMTQMILFDSCGYEDKYNAKQLFTHMKQEILRCDFILLVCKATDAARQPDKQVLNELQQLLQTQPDHPALPVLVVLTHIDQLRPVREWSPPYNVAQPDTPKALNIRRAMEIVATDLQVDISQVIPVNLQTAYNVEEGVLAAILDNLEGAQRNKYLRCVRAFKKAEYWQQLWDQTYNMGKILAKAVIGLKDAKNSDK